MEKRGDINPAYTPPEDGTSEGRQKAAGDDRDRLADGPQRRLAERADAKLRRGERKVPQE
jgi:hypothetical protein